jgi:EAL domain-containing protein (putative c-di-GMP-specific phosphodiesterase class I)
MGEANNNSASERQPTLLGVLGAVRELRPGHVETLLADLVEAARRHLDMEIGFISEFRGDRRYFRYVNQPRGLEILKVGGSDPVDETYCKRVVDGRLPGLIQNAGDLPEARSLAVTAELGIGAHLSAPISLADGTVFGTFCCFSLKPDYSLTRRDLSFLSAMADIAASILDRDLADKRRLATKRKAIEAVMQSGALTAVWQPIVHLESGKIIGVEALARFEIQPHRPPDEWFKEAAEVGLGVALEKCALARALEILPDLPADVYVTCNASAAAILDADFRQFLESVDLHHIVLEITEHDMVTDYGNLITVLRPLRARGLRLAVDDFGAGYASFRHILLLTPDIIKLDISLISWVDRGHTKKALLTSLIAFTRASQIELVAEGVETESELKTLRALGFRKAQGFLFHTPLDRRALADALK